MKFKTLPIFLAFFLMGVADAMGPMSDAVKKQLPAVRTSMATLLSFFVFIAFAVVQRAGRAAGGAHRQEEAAAARSRAQPLAVARPMRW